MHEFKPMHTIIPEGEKDNIRIEHFTVTRADSNHTKIRACMHPEEYVPAGKYVRLFVDGAVMMSDTPMEQNSNYDILYRANGHVLIAGLGIGMILVPLLTNPDVKSVTVIEKSAVVAELVGKGKFPNKHKLEIIVADIFTWKPSQGFTYDVMYFDIWENICTDNLDEIRKLKRKFSKHVNKENPKWWVGAWKEDHLKHNRRREKAEERNWNSWRR